MDDSQALVQEYFERHRSRLTALDSLVATTLHEVPEGATVLVPPGDEQPGALGVLQTVRRTTDDPRSPWHALTEYRLGFLFGARTEEPARAALAAERILSMADDEIDAVATAGDPEEEFVVTTAAKDESLTEVLLRHHLAPTTVTALRRVSAAEQLNDTYPISLPAGMRVVTVDEVDREELLTAAVRASMTEAMQRRPRSRDDVTDVLRATLDAQIEEGRGLSSVALRGSEIVGFSITAPLRTEEADRMDTVVRPLARCRLVWRASGESGSGVAHALMRFTHGRIAQAGIPWAVSLYPAGVPLSGYFWAREGYRPLSQQWTRSPARSH